jgi:hypothetical protein
MLKRLFLIPLLLLSLTACATTGTISGPTSPPTAVSSAQDAATKSLYAIGVALQATPGILDALYNAGKLSKEDYNKAVPVYNQALASFNLAANALKAATAAGQDPNATTAYLSALNSFILDKNNMDNLLTAFGQTPIGGAK